MKVLPEVFQEQELGELVTLADAMTGLMHELNNCLNRAALQASVVQLRAPQPLRSEVAQIRHELLQAAALLRPLQMVRQRQLQGQIPVVLNDAVKHVLTAMPRLAARVPFEPGALLPSLPLNGLSLQRLIGYFLHLALAEREDTATARLWTEAVDHQVRLVLACGGNGVWPAPVLEPFDPEAAVASPESLLERLAFQSLLRVLNGSLGQLEQPVSGWFLAWSIEE